MRFNTRNAYYLRISESAVLPLYLYLDEQHVEWMTERVLQHVLTDLRPLIIPKLIAEETAHIGSGGSSSAKKGTVDVHRGETYQFGYFLRNTEPHSVIIKTRRFTAALPKEKTKQALQAAVQGNNDVNPSGSTNTRKRSRSTKKDVKATGGGKRLKAAKSKAKGKQKATTIDSDEDEAIELSSNEDDEDNDEPSNNIPPRRSTRRRAVVAGGYHEEDADTPDVEMSAPKVMQPESAAQSPGYRGLQDLEFIAMDQSEDMPSAEVKAEESEPTLGIDAPATSDDPIEVDNGTHDGHAPLEGALLEDDAEEEKPKPIMRLQYQGFSIRGRALCVIVEPHPPLRKPPRAMSLAPMGIVAPRAPSIAPPDFVVSGQRARTPLFFPDDDRERSVTPAPWQTERERPPVPLFNQTVDDVEGDEADGGMLAFSQILHSVGEYATGAAEDDDEIEGVVFLGDADEARGL